MSVPSRRWRDAAVAGRLTAFSGADFTSNDYLGLASST